MFTVTEFMLLLIVSGLFTLVLAVIPLALGLLVNAANTIATPMLRIAVSLETIAKQGEDRFECCDDPNCPTCGLGEPTIKFDDDDDFGPGSDGDNYDYRDSRPPRKG